MDMPGMRGRAPHTSRLHPSLWRGRTKWVAFTAFVTGILLMTTAMHLEGVNRSVEEYARSTLKQQAHDNAATFPLPVSPSPTEATEVAASQLECAVSNSVSKHLPEYSSFECRDEGASTFVGPAAVYGFPIVNRSCVYHDVSYNPATNKFVFYAPDTPENRILKRTREFLPPVNLASRPYDLPILHRKRLVIKRKVGWSFDYTPDIVLGPIPACLARDDRVIGYYTPIVAPWNYAHTLFCDLFSLFWIMFEFNMTNVLDVQVVATSSHYMGDFPLPNKNKAFDFFSRRPPMYDVQLPKRVYASLIVGSGTKSWSWVTKEYAASGNSALWQAFRRHAIAVTGATDRNRTRLHPSDAEVADGPTLATPRDNNGDTTRPIRVSICHKKDKRGVVNYDQAVGMLEKAFPNRRKIEFVLEGAVGKSAKEQVQMMVDADVYMCNEGTLATAFMFMPPGAVFVSLPLVYHSPHLHQRKMPDARTWWRLPDMLRPDPRKNTGGNIDWFPPSIKWVQTMWYHTIPLNETQIQYPLAHLRNYMPDMNIVIQEERIVRLMRRAIRFLEGRDQAVWQVGPESGEIEVIDHHSPLLEVDDGGQRPLGYSINADICRQMLQRDPNMTTAFNSARCFYGMSWLCEMWSNTKLRWRMLHEKWNLSKGRCGGRSTSLEHVPSIVDPRVAARRLSEYLFYTKEELQHAYQTLDLGNFSVTDEDTKDVFPLA